MYARNILYLEPEIVTFLNSPGILAIPFRPLRRPLHNIISHEISGLLLSTILHLAIYCDAIWNLKQERKGEEKIPHAQKILVTAQRARLCSEQRAAVN